MDITCSEPRMEAHTCNPSFGRQPQKTYYKLEAGLVYRKYLRQARAARHDAVSKSTKTVRGVT